jgi:TonB family protein
VLAFLPGSQPPRSYNSLAAVVASAATAVLFTTLSGSASDAVQRGNETVQVFARYLLPPLPHAGRQSVQERLLWVSPSEIPAILPGLPSLAGLTSRRIRPGQGLPPASAPAVLDTPEFGTVARVYVADELDRPVMRDPSSAAPEYPPSLEKARIEGSVAVEFVVDTLGLADSASLNIISVSHIAFADAVREALPRMRFSPAELGGRHVPQRVVQQFKFVLPQTAANGRSGDAASSRAGGPVQR